MATPPAAAAPPMFKAMISVVSDIRFHGEVDVKRVDTELTMLHPDQEIATGIGAYWTEEGTSKLSSDFCAVATAVQRLVRNRRAEDVSGTAKGFVFDSFSDASTDFHNGSQAAPFQLTDTLKIVFAARTHQDGYYELFITVPYDEDLYAHIYKHAQGIYTKPART